MVIPREEKLVRLYIQLTTTEKGGGQVSPREIECVESVFQELTASSRTVQRSHPT